MIIRGAGWILAAWLIAAAALGAAHAQTVPAPAPAAPAAPEAPAPTLRPPAAAPRPDQATISGETRAVRAQLDAFKAILDQNEAALQGRELSEADLQRLRGSTEPLGDTIRGIVDTLQPKLDASKARLAELGPKPKEGQPEESADVVRDRSDREAAVADLDETQRLARALLVQATQIATQIGDRRRAAFTRALFQQSSGLLSPDLWYDVGDGLPREAHAFSITAGDTISWMRAHAAPGGLLLFGLALGVAIALYVGRRHLAPRLVTRDPAVLEPSRRSRLLAALGVFVLGAVPALLGSWIVWLAFDAADLVPPRIEPIMQAILRGLAFVAFVGALADAVLAPGHAPWRLAPVGEVSASRITTFVVTLASVMVGGRILEKGNEAISAALPITVITRALFAFAAALLFGELLRRFAARTQTDEECLGPYVPPETEVGGAPLRMLGWTLVVAVAGSVLYGYVALASFLVDQAMWISILIAMVVLFINLADEFIGGTLRGPSRIATSLQANTGLRRKAIEQIGVLASGAARVVLILAGLMLALAPWGIESSDIMSSVRAAFFGFQVGDVTISLSSIVIAALLFGFGIAITRIIQNWLDTTFLPATELDSGLRNSIRTAFGYFGYFLAGAVAFSYLGLSLDKIAIVAGALSVGIGFGLQSIVNNFVSGLILLWERPIRVGDLVVVGDGEGYVRRINVRATEIETFDRSTVIVPNSNLISGVVRNRVRSNRMGRVLLTIPVPRAADADKVAEVIRTSALAHREVMSEPGPKVLFKKIGETVLEFDLVCFVDDIDVAGRVSSELLFTIYRALQEAEIGHPIPDSAALMKGIVRVEQSLEHIADAIEDRGLEKPLPEAAMQVGALRKGKSS